MDKKNVKNELERVLYSILWVFVNHENVLPNLFVEGFTIYAKILTSHIEYKIEIIIKNNDLKKSMSMIFLHPGYERLNVDNETWVKAAIAELIYNMKEKSLFLEDEIEKPISFIEYQHLKTFITKIFELFCEVICNFTIKEQDSEGYRYFNLPLLRYGSREFCIANYHITARICLSNCLEFFSYKGNNKDINCRLSFKKPMFYDTDLKIWIDNSIRHVLVEILSLENHNPGYPEMIIRSFEPSGLFYDYCVNDVEGITNMIKHNIDNTCMMNEKLKRMVNMAYETFRKCGEKLSNVISNMIQNSSMLKRGGNNVNKKKK